MGVGGGGITIHLIKQTNKTKTTLGQQLEGSMGRIKDCMCVLWDRQDHAIDARDRFIH